MEKIMFSLWKPSGQSATRWREQLLALGDNLTRLGARQIRVMVVDAGVEKAAMQRMTSSTNPLTGMVSLWLDIGTMLAPVQAMLEKHAALLHAYQVREFVPYPEKRSVRRARLKVDVPAGQRTPGMCQLALFQRPTWLDVAQWTHYWRDCHSFNAYALQAIFDCRQNIVLHALSADAPVVHAIVEEHYPDAAIGSMDGFYGAQGDANVLYDREQALSESVCNFMDFGSLDCVLTSFYQVSS